MTRTELRSIWFWAAIVVLIVVALFVLAVWQGWLTGEALVISVVGSLIGVVTGIPIGRAMTEEVEKRQREAIRAEHRRWLLDALTRIQEVVQRNQRWVEEDVDALQSGDSYLVSRIELEVWNVYKSDLLARGTPLKLLDRLTQYFQNAMKYTRWLDLHINSSIEAQVIGHPKNEQIRNKSREILLNFSPQLLADGTELLVAIDSHRGASDESRMQK